MHPMITLKSGRVVDPLIIRSVSYRPKSNIYKEIKDSVLIQGEYGLHEAAIFDNESSAQAYRKEIIDTINIVRHSYLTKPKVNVYFYHAEVGHKIVSGHFQYVDSCETFDDVTKLFDYIDQMLKTTHNETNVMLKSISKLN